MKYSIVLSTTGTRRTLSASLANFLWFTKREDIELIVGTNNPNFQDFQSDNFKLVCHPEHRVCWSDAIDASTGEFIANVDDDLKLAKDYFTQMDSWFKDPTLDMVQPTLVDAEGYIVLRKHFRSYTISAFRRTLLEDSGMDYDGRGSRWMDNNIPFVEWAWNNASVILAEQAYAVHYGYPTPHGVDSTMTPYGKELTFLEQWRLENHYERINLNEILP